MCFKIAQATFYVYFFPICSTKIDINMCSRVFSVEQGCPKSGPRAKCGPQTNSNFPPASVLQCIISGPPASTLQFFLSPDGGS